MRWHRWSALTAALLVLGGCDTEGQVRGGSDAEAADIGATDAGATEAGAGARAVEERADPTAGGVVPGLVTPINRSGVRGRADVVPVDGDLRIVLRLEGLAAGRRYTAHVHQGQCAEGGPIRVPLGRVVADDGGTGSLRMRLEGDRLASDRTYFVQVHGPDDRPVGCADLGWEGGS